MKKKKRFYGQKHMDENAVMQVIVADIEKFCKAYYKEDCYRLAYLGGCKPFQTILDVPEVNFIPEEKKLADAFHNRFGQQENMIWISPFDIFADKSGNRSYYALYKMKNGQRLIIEKEALLQPKRILMHMQIGQKIYKHANRRFVEVTDKAECKKITKILSKL